MGSSPANPVYPYLFHFFKSRDLFPDRAFDFMSDTQTGAKSNILDLLTTPWTQTFTAISSFSSPGIFLLGFLGFLAVGLFKREARHKGYTAGALVFGLYWFITNAMTDRIRLGIAGIALGCYIMAHPAAYLYQRGSKFFRGLMLASVVAIGAFTGFLVDAAHALWLIVCALGRPVGTRVGGGLSILHPFGPGSLSGNIDV